MVRLLQSTVSVRAKGGCRAARRHHEHDATLVGDERFEMQGIGSEHERLRRPGDSPCQVR